MNSLSVRKGMVNLLAAAAFCFVVLLVALRMMLCGVLCSLRDRIFMGIVLICVQATFVQGVCTSYILSGKYIEERNIFGRCIKTTDTGRIRNITYYTKDITTFRRTRTEKCIKILLSDDAEYIMPYDRRLWECMSVIYADKII